MDRAVLARLIDHTLLRPEATGAEVEELCLEAGRLGAYAVCVNPSMLPLGGAVPPGVKVATVVGFPSGAHRPEVKADEAARAVAAGADEVDMVIDLGFAKAGRFDGIETEVALVRAAVPNALLKVIIESALLTDAEIVGACTAAVAAGCNFVKTSTGFHESGGATLDAVRLMRATVGPGIGVKASGGIRTAEKAIAMIEAGASRIGTSSTAAILAALG